MPRYQLHLMEAKKPFITISSAHDARNERCTRVLAIVLRLTLLVIVGGLIVYAVMEYWKWPIENDKDTHGAWNIKPSNGTHSDIGQER